MESMNEAMTHFTTGAMIVYGIQFLKNAGWFPWLTADSKTIARLVSLAGALIVGFGITGHWDPLSGGTIHLPPLAMMIDGLTDTVKQYMTNQVIYDTVTKQTTVVVQHELPSSLPATVSGGHS